MKYLIFILALLSPFTVLAGNGSGNVSNVVGFGGGTDAKGLGANAIFSSDVTKYYSVTCGFGTSNVAAGNYYKCRKQGGASGDWSISSTKTAYCPGFYAQTNSTANTAFSFGYGTAATAGNTSSGPTGDNSYATTGTGFVWGQASSNETAKWFPIPIRFDATVPAATIYPYIRVDGASTQSLNVNLICQDI